MTTINYVMEAGGITYTVEEVNDTLICISLDTKKNHICVMLDWDAPKQMFDLAEEVINNGEMYQLPDGQ